LPAAPANVSSCLSTQPFWNGTSCIQCSLPEYWNVSASQCLGCPAGEVFDTNLKNCTLPNNNTMSYLFGSSKWVANNLTLILAERVNKTALGNFTVCGKSTPYFDGVRCISCPFEFNITNRTCVQAPAGYAFDSNTHSYIPVLVGVSSNPNATNYILGGLFTLSGNYCNSSAPFFDGVGCVQCVWPFPYFNTSTLQCVQCSATKYFDNLTNHCVPRPFLYISVNFTNIMATANLSFTAYKAEIYNRVLHNGNAIIKQCAPGEYSNFNSCFSCVVG
jgi:hypothetical protein